MSNPRRRRHRRAAAREARGFRVNAGPPPPVRPHFPGVDPTAWTELPPAQYPPEVTEFIGLALELGENRKTIQGYRCDGCDFVLATRDAHPGYSPSVLDHARILDSRCPGAFVSFGYPDEDLPDGHAPVFEWYRPSETELIGLSDDFINHILKGGLILRRATGDTPTVDPV